MSSVYRQKHEWTKETSQCLDVLKLMNLVG